jgi:APA family basic amino acid/polyamine antiporter
MTDFRQEPATTSQQGKSIGLLSGIGMVVADMIGTGVFITAGFMVQDLAPHWVLLAWVVGFALALCGAKGYSAVAALVPRSGGEYRYLSELVHPALGYLAGWASLFVGFSAPIAIDALAAGTFATTIFPGLDMKLVATVIVVGLTGMHALGMRSSLTTQNLLVAIKIVLVVGFVVMGLMGGNNHWPTWQPSHLSAGFPLAAFMGSLFYIAFAFSGWNAAVYAAEEFKNPRRDVARAMLIGCAVVGALYLVVNWVFVANLTPDTASVVFQDQSARITLGHVITRNILGETGATFMSVLVIIALISATSAMAFIGPRVYAAMAKDGFLPRILIGREGKPPVFAVILQGAIALVLVFAYDLQQVLQNVGAILTLFSALTVLGLFRVRFSSAYSEKPSTGSLLASAIYVLLAGWMLYFGFREKGSLLLWVAGVSLVALVAYFVTRKRPAKDFQQ